MHFFLRITKIVPFPAVRFTETYGQFDVSASYDINENLTVFVEGINVTGEELRRHGRYSEQFIQMIDNGARYTVGVRTSF